MRLLALLVVVALCAPAFCDDPIKPDATMPVVPKGAPVDSLKLPPSAEVKRDHLVGIKAGTAAKKVTWKLPAGVDFLPKPTGFVAPAAGPVKIEMDSNTLLILTAPPGVYEIEAYAAVAESVAFSSMTLTVTGGAPAPTPPGPPAPKPDGPPTPHDKLKGDILDEYQKDANPAKKDQATELAAVYRLAAKEALDESNRTMDDLMTLIAATINTHKSLGTAALAGVRGRVKRELNPEAIDPATALSPQVRQFAADIYSRAAEALEGAVK